MKHHPPRLAKDILKWFCHAEFVEEVEGDLYELFQQRVRQQGLFRAKAGYWFDVLHSINPYKTAPRKRILLQSLPMKDRLYHFFRFVFRNMVRSRSSSLINLFGLAVSLASFLFIALYLLDETTYESMHPDSDQVYRISYSFKGFDGKEDKDARAAGLWSVTLKESMPEVKQFTRFSRFGYPGKVWSGNPDHVFVEQQFLWVDSTYTDIFSLELVSGAEAGKILRNHQYVIINETIAVKYFGETDPVGQSITYVRDGMSFPFIVGGVMKNYPSNTHFKPDFIANNLALAPLWKQNGGADRINSWGDSFSYSFVRLEPGTDLNKVKTALQEIFNKNLGDFAKTTHPILIPLRDIHFTPGLLFELDAPGDKVHLYIFASIGFMILAMACINYMNLATARSIRRSKEVGVRKTLGVSRTSLVAQFLGESFLMTVIALIMAIILFALFLPSFNALTVKHFSLASLLHAKALYLLLGAVVTVGLLSGSYPAFYLSGFRPLQVLKGTLVAGKGPENFRKTLVVAQISITLLLLMGTYVIHHQLAFIDHTKLSEYKDVIVTVRLGGDVNPAKIANYKQIVRQDRQVRGITAGPHLPRRENFGVLGREFHFEELSEAQYNWDQLDVDFDFPSLFQLEFVTGRNFSYNNPADTAAFILNETAVKELGLTPQKALGLRASVITYYEIKGEMVAVTEIHNVIGVVKDFNYESVRKAIAPIAISGQSKASEMMYIQLTGDESSKTIDHLVKAWKEIYPATPFQYWFMDEEFGRLYQTERQMGKLFMYLGGIAILIACLGLFGLASFTAEQKIKEIGIRKVLGASTFQVLLLLTSRYVKLAIISFFIGIPLAYVAIHTWMETFEYKAAIENSSYLWACVLIISIIMVTVSIESFRAARANPSDSIKHE